MSDDLGTLLRDRLDRAAAQSPPEPALSSIMDRCEGDLARHRRRTVGAAVAAAVAVAAVAVVAVGVPPLLDAAERSDNVSSAPTLVDAGVDLGGQDPEALIGACKSGAPTPQSEELMFAAGTPRIVAYSNATEQTTTVLVAADGSAWADCFNADGALDDADTVMNVFLPEPSTMAPMSAGFSCSDQPAGTPCSRFIVDKVDRLPADVEQVEFRTVDGVTTIVDVDNYGFVIFDYQGAAPETYTGEGTPPQVPWITRMTYLDRAGNVLAASRWTADSPSSRKVRGLPDLTQYPSLSLPADRT